MVDMLARHAHGMTGITKAERVATMRIHWRRDMGHYRMWSSRCACSTWNVMMDLHRRVVCMRVWMVRVHTHHWSSISSHHMRRGMNIGYVCGFLLFLLAFFSSF